jgi:hypothetical protein
MSSHLLLVFIVVGVNNLYMLMWERKKKRKQRKDLRVSHFSRFSRFLF